MNITATTTSLVPIDLSKLVSTKVELAPRVTDQKPYDPNMKFDNAPENIYATIEKNGKTIATFYKGGSMMTANSQPLPSDLSNEGTGLPLANRRIQQMLDAFGGTLKYTQDTRAQNSSTTAATLFAAQLAAK